MKILVAVLSCHKFDLLCSADQIEVRRDHGTVNARTQVVRETWAKTVKDSRPDIDLRFFYGYGAARRMEADEVLLSADDSYRGLVHKVKAVCRWALLHGYDLLLKVDDDTFLSADVIAAIDVDSTADYVGHDAAAIMGSAFYKANMVTSEDVLKAFSAVSNPHACGGCYRLSRRAMEIIKQTKITEKSFQFLGDNVPPCEDAWVGHTLLSRGITLTAAPQYAGFTDNPDVIRQRLQALAPNLNGGEISIQDFKVYLLLAPLLHFNCDEATMRRLYEKDLNGTLSASQ